MNSPDLMLAVVSAGAYLLATVFVGLESVLSGRSLKRVWMTMLILGFAVHTAALIARSSISGEVPFTDLFEYTLFFSWAMVLVYLVFFRGRLPAVGSLGMLVVVFLLLGSSFFYYSDPAGGTMPALKSYWLYIHVSLAALGETFFAIGFVASLIYLARSRTADRDSLRQMDQLTYRAISMGFPVFTAGAMVACESGRYSTPGSRAMVS